MVVKIAIILHFKSHFKSKKSIRISLALFLMTNYCKDVQSLVLICVVQEITLLRQNQKHLWKNITFPTKPCKLGSKSTFRAFNDQWYR
jgi:hypothetical protein